MTYFKQIKEKFQKDLYIKKSFSVMDSTTPWIPKVDIELKKIVCELNETPIGTGSSNVRFYLNKGEANESILFDANFSENENIKSTLSSYSQTVLKDSKITYSITSITSDVPGGQAIINFIYENV